MIRASHVLNDKRLSLSSVGLFCYTCFIANNTHNTYVSWNYIASHFQYVTPHSLSKALQPLIQHGYVSIRAIHNQRYLCVSSSMSDIHNSTESINVTNPCAQWLYTHHASRNFSSVYLTYAKCFHRQPPHDNAGSYYVISKIQSWLDNHSVEYINHELKYVRFHSKSKIQHPLAYFTTVFSKNSQSKNRSPISVTRTKPVHNHQSIPTISPAHSDNPLTKLSNTFSRIIQEHLD